MSSYEEMKRVMDAEKNGEFCALLVNPEMLPWFMTAVDRHATRQAFYMLPECVKFWDLWLRDCLREQGIAVTGFLIKSCKENRGTFITQVREYRLFKDCAEEKVLAAFEKWKSLMQISEHESLQGWFDFREKFNSSRRLHWMASNEE